MRRDEKFVGDALVAFFGGPSCASVSDGEDPPDLYLTVGVSRVGVEVTQLSQFTFEPDGTLGNRTTQDSFGLLYSPQSLGLASGASSFSGAFFQADPLYSSVRRGFLSSKRGLCAVCWKSDC